RREKQLRYNAEHGITPRQIEKALVSIMGNREEFSTRHKVYVEPDKTDIAADPVVQYMDRKALEKAIDKTRKAMESAARELDFIEAARLRDEMYALQKLLESKS
ncbi:MAG: excinuclease ABC subunit B, partial [Bacteroidales bacterium]|nr:excinuclease ABC subunit B [Bacteroidales bacterium]